MTAERINTPITDASAWKGEILQNSREWLTQVTEQNIADMERALADVRARGLSDEQIRQDDFPLPSLAARLDKR